MSKFVDESTRTNAYGNDNDEWGFMPGIGTYKKGNFKKVKQPDPDEPKAKIVSSMTWIDSERYHDENGVLRVRRITYKYDEDGNKIILPNE